MVKKLEVELERLRSAEFWNNWVYPEGAMPEDIQNELKDFKELMDRVSIVYCHVTGERVSKPQTTADGVIEAFEVHLQERIEEAIQDALE